MAILLYKLYSIMKFVPHPSKRGKKYAEASRLVCYFAFIDNYQLSVMESDSIAILDFIRSIVGGLQLLIADYKIFIYFQIDRAIKIDYDLLALRVSCSFYSLIYYFISIDQ